MLGILNSYRDGIKQILKREILLKANFRVGDREGEAFGGSKGMSDKEREEIYTFARFMGVFIFYFQK